jgi:hypothetical protein
VGVKTSVERPSGQGWCDWLRSNLVACSPDEGNESRDQKNNNEHPILAFETKKAKFLNEKFHRFRPFWGRICVLATEIYYFFMRELPQPFEPGLAPVEQRLTSAESLPKDGVISRRGPA